MGLFSKSKKGITGNESEWKDLCILNLHNEDLLVIDAQFVPHADDGLLVKMPPGKYFVEVKEMDFAGEICYSRMRVMLEGKDGVIGEELGDFFTDTAMVGYL